MAPRKKPDAAKDVSTAKGSLSDAERQSLFNQHFDILAEAAAKVAAAKEIEKAAKAAAKQDGFLMEEFKIATTLEGEDGEDVIKKDIERMQRIARWRGADVGFQAEMFADDEAGETRAFKEGKRDGSAGKPRKTDHAPGSAGYEQYMAGYQVGNEALARSGIKSSVPTKPGETAALADLTARGAAVIKGGIGTEGSTAQVKQ